MTDDEGRNDRSDRQEEFLSSWKRSLLSGRPSIGAPLRGLRGIAVMACSVALVVGVVIGGVAVVNTVAGRDGGSSGPSDTAALTSASLATAAPTTPAPAPSTTQKPKKTKHPKKSEPVRTRIVTRTTKATASPKAKKSDQQTKAEKKKAEAAAAATQASPGTTLTAVGVIKNLVTGMCVDLPGGVGDQDNQMFKKQAQGAGFYVINVKSVLCLDVSGDNNDSDMPDQKLTLFTCSPDDDHIWTFAS